ncbi:MAG: PilZ domain-containing protein [Candidatus Omnitrophica bacterium]|nr:PilZ domain-containing protein [Candidatus Omnitrophota bacterium]
MWKLFEKIKEPFIGRKRFHNSIDIYEKYDILKIEVGREPQPRLPEKKFLIERGRCLATASLKKRMAGRQFENRRRFSRVRYRTPLRYQIRGQSQFRDVETADLSVGGLSFTDGSFLPLNTPLRLEINLPYNKTLKSEGKIVWTSALPHSDSYHLGVEFLNMDRREMEYLDRLLSNQT